jgi:hypothetical protein
VSEQLSEEIRLNVNRLIGENSTIRTYFLHTGQAEIDSVFRHAGLVTDYLSDLPRTLVGQNDKALTRLSAAVDSTVRRIDDELSGGMDTAAVT